MALNILLCWCAVKKLHTHSNAQTILMNLSWCLLANEHWCWLEVQSNSVVYRSFSVLPRKLCCCCCCCDDYCNKHVTRRRDVHVTNWRHTRVTSLGNASSATSLRQVNNVVDMLRCLLCNAMKQLLLFDETVACFIDESLTFNPCLLSFRMMIQPPESERWI